MTPHPMTQKPAAEISPLNAEQLFEKMLHLSIADGAGAPRTLKAYREGLAIFLGWCGQQQRNTLPAGSPPEYVNLDARYATFEDIQVYRRWLIDKGYAKSTIKLRLQAVRILFTAMQRWGVRQDNPAAGVKAPRDKQTRADRVFQKALSPKEVRGLFLALPMSSAPQDIRDRAIITLMIFHGLRAEEVANLSLGGLDLNGFTWLVVPGKGDKPRTLVLVPEAREELLQWVCAGHSQEQHSPDHGVPLFYRFDVAGRCPISVRAVQRISDKYLHRAGLKRAGRSAHSLRHTHAVLSVLGGADREALGEEMGHANLTTTDIYIRAAAKYQQNPGDAVSKALKV